MKAEVSETQFSRSDWRPGARRKTVPRVRCCGGQKEAPLWLLAAGKLVGLHTNRAARCTAIALSTGRKCRRVAIKFNTRQLAVAHRAKAKIKKFCEVVHILACSPRVNIDWKGKGAPAMSNIVEANNLCPKCGTELRISWCAQCFGTGRLGKHKCKACGGKGMTTACPNVRAHKLSFLKFGKVLSKRLARFLFGHTHLRASHRGSPRQCAPSIGPMK